MGRLARRFGQRQGDDPSGHFRPKGLDARGPGLVAQKAIDAFLAKPLLPTPDRRLAHRRVLHDRHRAEPIRCGQHNPGAPDVLLRAVAVRNNGFQPVTVRGGHCDNDPGAHPQESDAKPPTGIHIRTDRHIHSTSWLKRKDVSQDPTFLQGGYASD